LAEDTLNFWKFGATQENTPDVASTRNESEKEKINKKEEAESNMVHCIQHARLNIRARISGVAKYSENLRFIHYTVLKTRL
jgi:hypothetical protein